jgi:serine/threonine protein kinase
MDTAALPAGSILADRYRIERSLGSGGMSRVYLAHDAELGRTVAVKVFPQSLADDDVHRQRDEARVLASLHHPGLVVLFDAQLSGEPPFLTMEYVAGESLYDRLARLPLPSADAVAAIIRDVAGALAYVHERGVIHRDVKPANILLPSGGEPSAKLADFGIARLMSADGLTATGTVLGTAAYISPEQASGRPVAAPSDIYSLGLVFAEALSGVRMFGGTALEAAAARLSTDPDLSAVEIAPFRGLIAAMTAREPDARPTAPEVVADLDGAAATRVLPSATEPLAPFPTAETVALAPPPAASAPSTPRRGRTAAVIAAAAIASLFCGAVAVLSLPHAVSPTGTSTPGAQETTDANPVLKVMPEPEAPQPEQTPPGHGPKPAKPGKHDKPGKGP